MTKIIPILALFFLSGIKLFAQCNPDTSIHKAGFYPKTLPDAEVNKMYDQTLNFKIFKDTVVIVFGSPQTAIVDSAVIVSVNNMPPGITFKLNKASQSYTPEEVGCAHISGVPTKTGKFTLDIIIGFYAKVLGFPVFQVDTINTFSINVTGTSSINDLIMQKTIIYPNPVKDNEINICINNPLKNNNILIYDSRGLLLKQVTSDKEKTKIDFDFPKGLYYILINNNAFKIEKY